MVPTKNTESISFKDRPKDAVSISSSKAAPKDKEIAPTAAALQADSSSLKQSIVQAAVAPVQPQQSKTSAISQVSLSSSTQVKPEVKPDSNQVALVSEKPLNSKQLKKLARKAAEESKESSSNPPQTSSETTPAVASGTNQPQETTAAVGSTPSEKPSSTSSQSAASVLNSKSTKPVPTTTIDNLTVPSAAKSAFSSGFYSFIHLFLLFLFIFIYYYFLFFPDFSLLYIN